MIFGTHWEYRGNSTEYEWEVATVMQGQYIPTVVLSRPAINQST